METNEPGGWDYDAWDEICTRLHCTPVYEEAYWGELIQAVADDQYDVAANGIAIRPKRAEIVDFSEGYISIKQRLLVRSDEIRITEIEDLVNDHSLNLGAIRGTDEYVTAYEYLSSHERIHGFETRTSAVQALISGDIDALIVTDIAGLGYVGEDADEVKLVGRQLTSEWLGFIYPKGSDLIDPVNLALQTMMEDGFLDDLNMKYFGPGFTITYDDIGPGIYGE
jgi:polar amino acid transport system substrate-binding protein